MAEKLTIQFSAKGAGALKKTLEDLHLANVKLTKGQKAFVTAQKQATKAGMAYNKTGMFTTTTNRLQSNSFATLRSKMLLASFAMGLITKGLIDLTKEFAKTEGVARGFDSLSRSIGGSAESLDKLKAATNNTVNNFELMKQSNNAVMLGVVKSDDEMAQLFDTAQRLGQALGVDTVKSIESLVTGMGRQSKLMLDNLGIVVKSQDAYDRYADKLDLSANSLTDAQKKEAFNQEVLRISKQMVDELGDEYISTQQKIEAMEASAANMRVELGEALEPVVRLLANSVIFLSEHLDSERMRAYGTAVAAVATTYVVFSGAVTAASKATLAFIKANKVMLLVMLAAVAAVELLSRHTNIFGDDLSDLQKEIDATKKSLEDLGGAADDTMADVIANEKAFRLYQATLQGVSGASLQLIGVEFELAELEAKKADAIGLTAKERTRYFDLLRQQHVLETQITTETIDSYQQMAQEVANVFGQIAGMAEASANKRIAAIDKVMNHDINTLKKSRRFQKLSAFQQAKEEEKIRDRAEKKKAAERAKANKIRVAAFRMEQALNIASVVQDTAAAIMKAQAQTGIFGAGWIPFFKALGAAQIAMIASQKPPRMEQGGLIGGRRHSQGGTMIEAEAGEFVVSRQGVESVGIETLNRINQGGGSSNVNIVFEGNVLSEDFIVDEAIPKIKEALRRGEDIGIS
tara:strand:- start:1045 stop:3114 length:2070 start_codon:yes stop_codon:yes gene_type:complete